MTAAATPISRPRAIKVELSPAHFLRMVRRRKWLVMAVFVATTVTTVVVVQRLPNIYTSETVILVDPQKIPERYVTPTVTGDVRSRLGTLTQQILSATRLQKIIESFQLYPAERAKLAREDVIARMRSDINVQMVAGGDAGSLQSFRISYSGKDPQLVARVVTELASLFIDENLQAREHQATDTTDFLQHQLDKLRQTLEAQENKLRDFRLKHIGEMPEHETADLTVLGQLRAAVQQEGEGLARAEQQRTYIQAMMSQTVPVIDVDAGDDTDLPQQAAASVPQRPGAPAGPVSTLADRKTLLATLLNKYTDQHPEVVKLRQQIAEQEGREAAAHPAAPVAVASAHANEPPVPAPPAAPPAKKKPVSQAMFSNPVLAAQIKAADAEIAKHKAEEERINKLIASYQAKLEAIPVREQQIADLVRDYEINKAHYTQFLDKQLSAETATQLEIRQKGEQFSVLDPALPAQRPSKPQRGLIDAVGSVAGLLLGVLLAIAPEFARSSISSPDHVSQQYGNQVLEVIPVILTHAAKKRRKTGRIVAAVSGAAATVACLVVLLHFFRAGRF